MSRTGHEAIRVAGDLAAFYFKADDEAAGWQAIREGLEATKTTEAGLRASLDALKATNGGRPVDDDPEPAPPTEHEQELQARRLRAAIVVAADPVAAEALARGEPVPASQLDPTWRELLKADGELVLDEATARRIELLRRDRLERDPDPQSGSESAPGALKPRRLDQVEMRSIEWFERPLWQRSAFQLLAGPKGSGKGTYTAGLGARFSRAGYDVLYISTEDSTAIDLKPRLVAAGADLERCFDVTEHVHLPDDVERLHALAASLDRLGLLVIDPVANHIGDSNSNHDTDVRHAISPLNRLADELGCLIIGIRHPGKDRSRGAVASILGSTAWVDTPRAVVFIAADDEDPLLRHIQVVAGNRSATGRAQAFRIEAVDVPGLREPITRAVELGESSKDVETLLADAAETSSRAAPKRDEAKEIILRELREEPRPLDYLKATCAAEAGLSGETTYRAANALKAELRVRCSNSGPGTPWLWSLTSSPEEGLLG